jgi:hypothetical protein
MTIITPKLLIKGNFSADDLIVSVSPSNLVLIDSIKKELEHIWDKKIIEAKKKGLHLYNGMSYRLNSYKKENGKIHLDFGTMDFKTRYGLKEALEDISHDEAMYRKGCYVGATVKTSDNKYLMIKLSGKSMNTNTNDVLGGIMETNITMDSEYIFNVLYSELNEEAGIKKKETKNTVLRAIYISSHTNIGFYCETELLISSNEILERFTSNVDIDVAGIEVYSYKEYLKVLKNHSSNKRFMYTLLKNQH